MISGIAHTDCKEYMITTVCVCAGSERYETEIKAYMPNRFTVLDGFTKTSKNKDEASLTHRHAEIVVSFIEEKKL